MKALVYKGAKHLEIEERPLPKASPDKALVKIKYCGICGGDMGIYAGTHPRAAAPLVMGHEFVGTIEAISDSSQKFKKGDRVIAFPLVSCGHCISCRSGIPHICQTLRLQGIDFDGGFSEYALVDNNSLIKVDDRLSDYAAALIEPLAVVVRAVHQAKFSFLDSALVMGAGPIGILNALVLRECGASKIVISDLDQTRLDLCKSFGFETVNIKEQDLAAYISEATNGDGMDAVFECSGTESATFQATQLAKMEGTICMTGIHKAPHVSNLPEFSFKEQTFVATRVYTRIEFEHAAALAVKLQGDLEKLVSHVIPLEKGAEAFAMQADPSVHTVKVLIDCN